ncbi:MAG TPA: ferrochelatase [Candidatus Sulfotelmatobacter sp.]|jgi:ferrochelatase|nr:ferrochelatase [Candidatus Sulfotelmatobacter sp.]
MNSFDALLIVSFGGPEKHEDVLPFLENVLRGKNVPRERMLEVAEHYYHFDGRSPINDQNRELLSAVQQEFKTNGPRIPVYWGNRNWHPLLADALRQMKADGVRRAATLATSAFGSYSGCRQYREDIARAQQASGTEDLIIEKLPNFCDRPEFIETMVERVRTAMNELPGAEKLVFTAHSIPLGMAEQSPYVRQLKAASAAVAAACGVEDWKLVYQSRSGPPTQPWLMPDICEHLRAQRAAGVRKVIICPIGFISDHMEVLYDLDTEARAVCDEIGLKMVRAGTAGSHPRLISMVRDMVLNADTSPVMAHCEPGCCPAPQRPAVARPLNG